MVFIDQPSITTPTTYKNYAFTNQGLGAGGSWYIGGFYAAPAAEAALDQASPSINYKTAGRGYAAHAFVVAKGDGATDGSDLVLLVSGVSINDNGTRNDADSEVIVGDALAATFGTNTYFETTKKWLGQVTFTLTSTGGTVFNCSFNYGLCKYEDFGNKPFTVTDFECVWLGGANETDFDIKLIHHKTTGWTYSAAAFDPGPGNICSLLDDYTATNDNFGNGEHGAYKRSNLSTAVEGNMSEGIIIRLETAVNNSIESLNAHVGVTL